MFRSLAALALVLALLGPSAPALAQDDPAASASMQRTARDLYEVGVRAARERDWDAALAAFTRSYALYPRPITLMNLAGAQQQTGRLVAASETYRRFLRDASESERARYGADVERAALAIEARIAHVVLRLEGLGASDAAQLDGAPLDRLALGTELAIDPGEHRVTVQRGHATIAERAFTAADGERLEVTLEAPGETAAVVPPPAEVAQRAVEREVAEDPIVAAPTGDDPTPWIVVGVAAGVLAIAAVIVTVVLVTENDAPNAPDGTEPPWQLD